MRYWLQIVALLFAAQSWAAVAYDTSATATEAAQDDTISLSIAASGSNRLLLCALYWNNPANTVSSITHNAVGMTRSAIGQIDLAGWTIDVFSLIAPATGSQTVSVTFSATGQNKALACMSFTGVHQTTPIGTGASFIDTANPMSATISIPSDGAGTMFCINADNAQTYTPGANQTEPFADFDDTDVNHRAMASYTLSSGSIAMTFTNANGNYGACIALPLSSAGAVAAVRPARPVFFQ